MQAAEIKALRAEAGMSQSQFARAINVESITVSRWERGLHTPLPECIEAIEARFGRNRPATKKTRKPVNR